MSYKKREIAVALTIAGSDSGGGAGIQADLKTFAAIGVHGTSAITCITAQNPGGVYAVQPIKPTIIQKQIEAVFEELPPKAIKTGMLYSSAIIKIVAQTLKKFVKVPLIVDPVIVSTSGATLLKNSAISSLIKELLPMATLIMPNLDEARILYGKEIADVEEMRIAVRELKKKYRCAVLLKGGHLKGMKEAIDIYLDDKEELLLTSPYIKGVSTHGTGCTYSSAVTACIAKGMPMQKAVIAAKQYITNAIANSLAVCNHSVLNHLLE